ncbi:hypothetical protein ABZX62_20310 [Streptomyces flavidovirens]|uniref:hypothetical protein n=1 Tax=Streptomyces flavidovirens TaxID=67298 RepID=UPI0033A44E1A
MLRTVTEAAVLNTVTDIGGLVALTASVLFLAWQTKISNDISGASVLGNAMASDRDVDRVMLEYPGLRAYFYEGKPCPRRGRQRERVLLLAGMYADVLEGGLMATRRVRSSESYEDWLSYSQFIVWHSPTMQSFVKEHPDWWPNLAKLA